MENAEEIFHSLDDFSKRKPKTIPQELNEYLAYVARTGDPVYQWSLVKSLFKEKLLNVITDFYETTPGIVIPPYPNVDPFNYDIMKNSLLERLDSFTSAPFTVQRLCELLTFPRKQYNRVDKFMRAIEKNILVVSTREPGIQRHSESENGDANEPIHNGSGDNSEYHVDVEMEDMSRKENNEQWTNEPQPGSSDTHISVDDIEARLKAKESTPTVSQDKKTTEYESVTPPELNVSTDVTAETPKETPTEPEVEPTAINKEVTTEDETPSVEPQVEEIKDVEMKTECASTLVIPEIRVDDAEMTEQKLIEQANIDKQEAETETDTSNLEPKSESAVENIQVCDESSSDSKDESETKLISEVSTSSEESSSSSDNTDGSSSSPKTDECHIDIQEESNQSDATVEVLDMSETNEVPEEVLEMSETNKVPETDTQETKEIPPVEPDILSPTKIESEAYSISDVQSELPPVVEEVKETPAEDSKEEVATEPEEKDTVKVEESVQKKESLVPSH